MDASRHPQAQGWPGLAWSQCRHRGRRSPCCRRGWLVQASPLGWYGGSETRLPRGPRAVPTWQCPAHGGRLGGSFAAVLVLLLASMAMVR